VRVVADTNVIVSAFLWGGVPRQLLDAAEAQRLELFTSRALIAELEDVLSREKLAAQLQQTRFTAAYLLARYTQLRPHGPSIFRRCQGDPGGYTL
jgi:uncharacterized protein